MPILWFEQHVKMSEDIGNEVKFLLSMPTIGIKSGFLLVLLGSIQILFVPLTRIISRLFSAPTKNLEMNEIKLNKKEKLEISPLMKKKISQEKT